MPLYYASGFEPLRAVTFDLSTHGGEGTQTYTQMIREAAPHGTLGGESMEGMTLDLGG